VSPLPSGHRPSRPIVPEWSSARSWSWGLVALTDDLSYPDPAELHVLREGEALLAGLVGE
jgi:hypothetical protein